MKRTLILCGMALSTVFVACEDDDDMNNVSAQDRTFASQAAISNRTEIIMGNMALSKATDISVRNYAQQMIIDHTAAETELKTIAADESVEVTADSLDADGVAMRGMLMALTGRSFDSAYIHGQVAGHEKAVANMQTEINSGSNAALRNFATTMLPKIQMHLAMADTMSARF